MAESKETRREILDAAQREFVSHGVAGARMQEIADKAGVNKAMIHYYFNSKEELFQKTFEEALENVFSGLLTILNEEMPLLQKIEQFINKMIDRLQRYPGQAAFIMESLNRNSELTTDFIDQKLETDISRFEEQLSEAAADYRVADIDARQVLVNILSLSVFPYSGKTFVDRVVSFDSESERGDFLEKRKGIVCDTVLNWLTS